MAAAVRGHGLDFFDDAQFGAAGAGIGALLGGAGGDRLAGDFAKNAVGIRTRFRPLGTVERRCAAGLEELLHDPVFE